MSISELLEFINSKVPTFQNSEIIGPGEAFHYTMHSEAIQRDGIIKGRPIDKDIDCTQSSITSTPATDSGGVVFSYADLEEAKLEAYVMPEDKLNVKILKIKYKQAIRTTHIQEEFFSEAPETIIIIASDIIYFKIAFSKK
jgi:hypothetical protein